VWVGGGRAGVSVVWGAGDVTVLGAPPSRHVFFATADTILLLRANIELN